MPARIWRERTVLCIPRLRRIWLECVCCSVRFSTPGGFPSHCGPHTPNSMHEGGELGYSLVHAFGAAFDNPRADCGVRGWRRRGRDLSAGRQQESVKFLNPARDGAVLPILHLNGYKISGPTVLARTSDSECESVFKRTWVHSALCGRRRSGNCASAFCRRAG